MRLIGVDVGGTFTDLVYADTDAGRTANANLVARTVVFDRVVCR